MPPPASDASSAAASEAADLAACRASLRGGSRTFFAASKLLPRRVFEPAAALYAFCRLADDAVDCEGHSVASLRVRLRQAYDGHPFPVAADRALAAVIRRHNIPSALPEALLEGFAWDAEGRRYQDFPALLDYAARVAGSVGAMMSVLMNRRAPDVVARACDLGIAMQLSNIARDVGEDARAGRLYLPLQWLREAGIDPDAWLAAPVFNPALAGVVARLLCEADWLYWRASAGIARLPPSCRPGIRAAQLLYAGIGHAVAARGCDSVTARAFVPGSRKAVLLARSLVPGPAPDRALALPTLEAARFLVEAVAAAPVPRKPAPASAGKSFDDQAAWVVDLFVRLGERQEAES
ncbi:MAG: phytoene/squalene synthase family protein [Acetobacteraceae bacterium]|nr:phytoene/squalene synthase family protein [Acetobacteraceae bacterium]